MNMIRQTPRQPAGSLQEEIRQAFDRLFDSPFFADGTDESSIATAQWVPPVDVREEGDRFVLYADLPGVHPDEIEVQMDKGILSIKGERRAEARRETERYSRIERRYGRFHRRFALPDSADADGIQAHGRDGVLEIVIPKRPETTPRRIQVGRPVGDGNGHAGGNA